MKRLSAFILSLVALPATASNWKIDAGHSSIGFNVRNLVTLVSGSFVSFDGNIEFENNRPEESKVTVTIQTESIFTANSKRDEHLRSSDFLDTKRYPSATFESTRVSSIGKGQFRIEGLLTLRGVTKPVELLVDYLGTAKDLQGQTRGGFVARTKLSQKQFGIQWNKLTEAGNVVVSDDVDLTLNISAIEQRPQAASNSTNN